MSSGYRFLPILILVIHLVLGAGTATAARVQYHYGPDACGNLWLQSATQSTSFFTGPRPADGPPPRPTHFLTFIHPYTGGRVTVPITFPEGTPRIEYRYRGVIYNYGSYTVEVHFLPDGSVDVVYNSGLLRAL